jgi:hypothetical protein
MRAGDAARGEQRVDKSLKEYAEFRAAMKETIDDGDIKETVVKQKKEKKDKGKEKAVEQEVDEEEDGDDSAWLGKRRKETLDENEDGTAPSSTNSKVRSYSHRHPGNRLTCSSQSRNNSSSRLVDCSSVI